MSEDKGSATAALSARSPRDKFPAWLVYSILTLLLWGIWGATSKAISDDINAYTNQLLFGLGMAPLLLLVAFSPRLKGAPGASGESFMRSSRGFWAGPVISLFSNL